LFLFRNIYDDAECALVWSIHTAKLIRPILT